MARTVARLTDAAIKAAKAKGYLADGAGLYLQVSPRADGTAAKSWIVRYVVGGRTRDMGLGAYPEVTLSAARTRAAETRDAARRGEDPLTVRQQRERADEVEERQRTTFKAAAEEFIAAHAPTWSAKNTAQWRAMLKAYAYPKLGALAASEIDTPEIVKVLEPIWLTKAETARQVRGKIERVLNFCGARGYRDLAKPNPALWKGRLEFALSGRRRAVKHHAALPYAEAPAFMAELAQRPALTARMLELTILLVPRTTEVRGGRWEEIDYTAPLWTIPAARMKGRDARDHRIPLPAQAVARLDAIARSKRRHPELIFPGQKAGQCLSNMAMLNLLKRMGRTDITPHGFRSTFRDWAAEETDFPREVAEMALAHAIGDDVEAAYRRGELLAKRRELMQAWADYLLGAADAASDGNVIPLRAEAHVGKR